MQDFKPESFLKHGRHHDPAPLPGRRGNMNGKAEKIIAQTIVGAGVRAVSREGEGLSDGIFFRDGEKGDGEDQPLIQIFRKELVRGDIRSAVCS